MRWGWMVLSFSSLAVMLVASSLTAAGLFAGATNRWVLLGGTLLWFASAPWWMLRPRRGR
jgi:hypothetical protein